MSLVYCVEDDNDIRDLIVYALKSGGFEAEGFCDSNALAKGMAIQEPDALILDLMLPGKDGTQILEDIRRTNSELPVIILTAKNSEMDKVKLFDLGADDYMTKPFSVLELLSRIKAVLKRAKRAETSIMEHNGITIDTNKRSVTIDGEPVSLTFKEFELLAYLVKHKGSAINRETLINKIWGYDFMGESRTLDVHIGSLRHKLGTKGASIETIRNVGYKLS